MYRRTFVKSGLALIFSVVANPVLSKGVRAKPKVSRAAKTEQSNLNDNGTHKYNNFKTLRLNRGEDDAAEYDSYEHGDNNSYDSYEFEQDSAFEDNINSIDDYEY